jgi:hypothetical protein
MGTGGTLAVWSPANLRRIQGVRRNAPGALSRDPEAVYGRRICGSPETLGALGGLFLPQPDLVNGWFIPDKKRQTGATQFISASLPKTKISHNEIDWYITWPVEYVF